MKNHVSHFNVGQSSTTTLTLNEFKFILIVSGALRLKLGSVDETLIKDIQEKV